MASESAIKAAIEKSTTDHSVWTIGVTDDLDRCKRDHGNPYVWHHWDADSEQAARNVEAYFLEKGMKGAKGGGGGADYVYIFI